MNDQMMTQDLLYLLKSFADLHLHGTIEASTLKVRQGFEKSLTDILAMQNEVATFMTQKGWYQMEQAQQQSIDKAKQKYAQAANQGQ